MEFTIHKSEFNKALATIGGVANTKSGMDILANVHLSASKKGLSVTATDLCVGISGSYSCDTKRPGGVLVDAKKLAAIVKGLPEDSIRVVVADDLKVSIKSGKAEYKIHGSSEADYPRLPETTDAIFSTLDADVFSDMIAKTLFSASDDETRAHLSGIFVKASNDKLLMVSTDGHRLSIVSRSSKMYLGTFEGVIIPRKGVIEIRKLLKGDASSPVEIGLRGSNVYLRRANVTLSVKLIDATFPDYEQVIPKNTTKRAVVHRQQLIDCLKRISLLSADSAYGVKMSFAKNTLTISSDDQKFGEAREQLDIEYSSEPMTIGINAQYMSDVLSASSDVEFGIALTDETSPCLLVPVDDSEYQCVVMPMRL